MNKQTTKKEDEQEQQQLFQNILKEKQDKLRQNQNSDISTRVKIAIENPPLKCNDEQTIEKYVLLVQNEFSNIKGRENELVNSLNDEEAVNLYEYINKSFQYISEGKSKEDKFLPGKLLKIHSLLIQKFGKSLILRSICKKKALIQKIDNFKVSKDINQQ
ncbi:hypothetical protein IMG5_133230 [Ichthyophthirius multifiliis]|uniref:Uncharacterized protein n=1 Tax=Ichthyophthirius multifiliis TaxID=5932 RepID=G0QWL1_ICHMU|nr:hypothetical protein IMG5_133230 [Ichthyophthirius multifiliis]EGR30386.1 hypothetical protein IMG5_133230 [Ichthyophthirius multifiliis]|eukprot:XP_004031973.1 hypothetical protein IMG5_133230 [Ichthyophthirius multifiliis]